MKTKRTEKLKWWHNVQEFFNLKGGAVMGTWSFMMISLSIFCVLTKRELPATVTTAYGIVVSAFAVHKTFKTHLDYSEDITEVKPGD